MSAPLADDGIVDEVAVERACRGVPVPLRPAERLEAVRILTARGHGPGTVARTLRMSSARVARSLAELAEQTGAA